MYVHRRIFQFYKFSCNWFKWQRLGNCVTIMWGSQEHDRRLQWWKVWVCGAPSSLVILLSLSGVVPTPLPSSASSGARCSNPRGYGWGEPAASGTSGRERWRERGALADKRWNTGLALRSLKWEPVVSVWGHPSPVTVSQYCSRKNNPAPSKLLFLFWSAHLPVCWHKGSHGRLGK